MATERLYYTDCYRSSFDATVVAIHPSGAVELDRTAFYPESGGQSHDLGVMNGQPVTRVIDDEDRVLHEVALPLKPGDQVHGEIDWGRRFDLMQHHTGQHLLSAVAEALFGWTTLSVHMSPDNATVEFGVSELAASQLATLEEECNRRIQQNLPVHVNIHASPEGLSLRKAPVRTGPLRVVSIGDLDHSACGGTHVRATGEIGCLSLGRMEKIRKNTRIEFACGMRAVQQGRLRADWLAELASLFQTSADRIAPLALAQREELQRVTKQLHLLQLDEAVRRGRELRSQIPPEAGQLTLALRETTGPIGDLERAFAQAFCTLPASASGEHAEGAGTVLLTIAKDSGAFLLCASDPSRFDAKAWFGEVGKSLPVKGGGSPTMVNGRLQQLADIPRLISLLPIQPILLPDSFSS